MNDLVKKMRGYTIFLPHNRENIQKLPFCRGLIVCASFLLVNVEPVRSFDFSCYFPIHGKKASTSTRCRNIGLFPPARNIYIGPTMHLGHFDPILHLNQVVSFILHER